MKKYFIISILFSFIAFSCFAQEVNNFNSPVLPKDYLKLSRDQKTAGFVCLGVTGVMVAIAAKGKIDFVALSTVAEIGLVAALTSIPFFIASARNKRKGLLMATTQKTAFGMPYKDKFINGITLRLPLGR